MLGVKSFGNNISAGNYEAAALDGIGVVLDAVAAVLPFIPGGVGTEIKIICSVDNVVDVITTTNNVDNAVGAIKTAENFKITIELIGIC